MISGSCMKTKLIKLLLLRNMVEGILRSMFFLSLDADDVDENTSDMEKSIGNGYIIVREVFGLNNKTRSYAERWVELANNNPDEAVGL